MKENETIVEMITRFITLSMVLKHWERPTRNPKSDEDLEVTPIKVAYKGHTIQEAKDLTKLPMEELIGSLMTYEINLAKKLQEVKTKEESIALKATTKEEEDVEEKTK
ncbi:hypothetical protein CK203_048308 [Vitis vinifera]|uniref:Uncharacterized protein n=1 Tax=Vitis vinifera TaxID=29760 RepID=A0A438H0Z9_VITVI|nr:hypothetical protein CK203_048308 [Vitis vinifera]